MPFFLETAGLGYSYRTHQPHWVLNGVDLSVRPREFVLLCGPSGSGKSTLCRTFNGLIPHFYNGSFRGEVRVAGKSTLTQSVGDLFRHVGMVFQNPETQLFNRTVEQEIAFGLESLGMPRDRMVRRISESAEAAGISDLLARNPHQLSGGEQQLTAIAAILALNSGLIILDEPYANLDPLNVRRVRKTLQAIHRKGVGVFICEHRLPYTMPDVERMVVIQKGNIVLDGSPPDLLHCSMEGFGLQLPLAARIGLELDLKPLPLDVGSLKSILSHPPPRQLGPALLEPVPESGSPLLSVEKVSFHMDGKKILRDVSFSLRQGECLAVVGANGAGKTVLLKHLNGLFRPSEGRVMILGEDSRKFKVSRLAEMVGVAFQNPNNQFFKLTVRDEISVGARALNRFDENWIEELVRLFHLEPLLDRTPFRLSGGEKKRVAFAAALAAKPAVLALDEPTAGQGWYFREALGSLLERLRDMGQSVILVTHDLAFAEQHTHRWLLMTEGRVTAEGTPWEVMADTAAMERAHLEPTDAFQIWGSGEGHR